MGGGGGGCRPCTGVFGCFFLHLAHALTLPLQAFPCLGLAGPSKHPRLRAAHMGCVHVGFLSVYHCVFDHFPAMNTDDWRDEFHIIRYEK